MKLKYNQNKKNTKLIYTVLTVVIVAVLGFAAVYATSGSIFGWQPLGGSAQDDALNEQIDNGQQIKQDSLEDNDGKSGSDQPAAPQQEADGKQKVEVDIVSVNKVDSTLKVSSLISVLDQTGTCTITVSNSSSKAILYTTTVGVQALSNTSTCKGFDIALSDIQAEKYTIALSYSSGTMYGTAMYESE